MTPMAWILLFATLAALGWTLAAVLLLASVDARAREREVQARLKLHVEAGRRAAALWYARYPGEMFPDVAELWVWVAEQYEARGVSAEPRAIYDGPVFSCTVPGNPIPKARPRVVRGHAFTPDRTRDWEMTVAMHARQVWGQREKLRGRLCVRLSFWRETRHVCDLDNLLKAVLDGLERVVFANDNQVDMLHVIREIDRERPRVEIEIVEVIQ